MGRRYIGIEMGEQAVTHCAPRLRKVIEGKQGGVSKAVGWDGGRGFRFFRLGPAVFDENGRIREGIGFGLLAAHIWFAETDTPLSGEATTPVLGVHDNWLHALLYNGVLADKRPQGGNVLTRTTLALIRGNAPDGFDGPMTIYGEQTRLSVATLERERITFKQTPYDVSARA